MKRSRKNEDMLLNLKWEEVIDFQQNKSISIRQACKILQCDRSWINRYVQPYCHYVYLSNGYAARLGCTESVWIDKKEFNKLILDNIKCSRQTINIPVEFLIEPSILDKFKTEYLRIEEQIKRVKNDPNEWQQRDDLYKKRWELVLDSFSDAGKKIFWTEDETSPYMHRSKYEAVELTNYIPNFMEWHTVADMKGYGDYSEQIYRVLFKNGAIKCELNLCDSDGKQSQKIYYIKDPKFDYGDTVGAINVPYKRFVDFF